MIGYLSNSWQSQMNASALAGGCGLVGIRAGLPVLSIWLVVVRSKADIADLACVQFLLVGETVCLSSDGWCLCMLQDGSLLCPAMPSG